MDKPKKIKAAKIDEAEPHVLIKASAFLSKHMSDDKKTYWTAQARKKQMTLDQIVVCYLAADFGITYGNIPELANFLKRKEKLEEGEL